MSELAELRGILDEDPAIAEKRARVLEAVKENDVSSFPSDMSIFAAFDEAMLCFAFGGQVRHYYRYGTWTLCEEARAKFKFAVMNGTLSEKPMDVESVAQNPREMARREKVQDFYRQQLLKKKAEGSLEDIWNERSKLLVSPFQEEFKAAE